MSAIERFYTSGHKIIRSTSTSNEYNEPITSWSTSDPHLTLKGKLWSLSGRERFASGKDTLFAEYKFACKIADITEEDRYIDPDNNVYDIVDAPARTRPSGDGHMELALELRR